ncbi:MAG TPA: hypothetical protein VIN56_12410 [Candidatus Dormibacteraeota bacterium]|jgi:predicted amidohydrolase
MISPRVAALVLALAALLLQVPSAPSALATSANCSGTPDAVLTGGGQVRIFAMHHKQDLADNATYQSIRDALDCELTARVDPYRAADHPNVVVYNELNGLSYGTEGARGASARAGLNGATLGDQLIGQSGALGIGTVAYAYSPQLAAYEIKFGAPSDVPTTVDLLFTAITDTLVRAVVENLSALAQKHGVYIVFGTPLVVQEGAACTGQYAGWAACPGWHRSSDTQDILKYADPEVSPTYAYVADTKSVDNVELFFAPDGTLYDMQPKVNLTPIEINPLGWHQGGAATIHAIGLHGADAQRFPAVKFGVGISLDAFETTIGPIACPPEAPPGSTPNPYPQFMQCLDSKGVNVFLQPEFNDGSAACVSWTDFTEDCNTSMANWQPLSWMRSAWFAVQGRKGGALVFKNFQYAVNPFMTGNLFDISGDGQSAIFARDDPRARPGWYAGDSLAALYTGAGVGVYTDRRDDPRYASLEGPQPGFLALTPWTIPEGTPASAYRCRPLSRSQPDCSSSSGPPPVTTPGALSPGDPGSLQSCEKGLAPGSGVTTGPCAENNYRSSVLVADLFPAVAAAATPAATPVQAGLPPTSVASGALAVPLALVAIALLAGYGRLGAKVLLAARPRPRGH